MPSTFLLLPWWLHGIETRQRQSVCRTRPPWRVQQAPAWNVDTCCCGQPQIDRFAQPFLKPERQLGGREFDQIGPATGLWPRTAGLGSICVQIELGRWPGIAGAAGGGQGGQDLPSAAIEDRLRPRAQFVDAQERPVIIR